MALAGGFCGSAKFGGYHGHFQEWEIDIKKASCRDGGTLSSFLCSGSILAYFQIKNFTKYFQCRTVIHVFIAIFRMVKIFCNYGFRMELQANGKSFVRSLHRFDYPQAAGFGISRHHEPCVIDIFNGLMMPRRDGVQNIAVRQPIEMLVDFHRDIMVRIVAI